MNREMLRQKYIMMASPVIERLEGCGFEAYMVGGCVRDAVRQEHAGDAFLRGKTDIDIATEARPEEVSKIFSDWIVIETGMKHGTVTVLVPYADPVEVTTFRSDGEYSDGRRPDRVRFISSIEEDLARRDFTVNAMAMDIREKIIDPFGGQEDLKNGLIRAVGEPEDRFREDGLRILRALRFASALGFSVEERTSVALHRQKELLQGIAAERIFVELKKLLAGVDAGRIVREYVDVIEVVIPELKDMEGFLQHNPYHSYDVLEHCIRAMENIEIDDGGISDHQVADGDRIYMKIAALLHDVGKPSTFFQDEEGIGHFYGHPEVGEKICRRIMNRLGSDGYTKDKVCSLVKYHDLLFELNDPLLKRWLRKFGPKLLLEILALKRADNIATGNASHELIEKFDRIDDRIRRLIEEEACFSLKDLAVNGRDLIDEGIAEGPILGEILDHLLDRVMDESLPNEKEPLLIAAIEYMSRTAQS